MSIKTIKIDKRIAAGLNWVLDEGSIHVAEEVIETGLTDFDWTEDQVTELTQAIIDISNCLNNEKHFKVTISKK